MRRRFVGRLVFRHGFFVDAFLSGEYTKAERAAGELMQLVNEARARFGERLDWLDEGRALWRRAKETTGSDDAAGELTDAIAQHAYRKHWGHTVLGLLACRSGDLDTAVGHLLASAEVRPDYRLSSYGPSLDLLRGVPLVVGGTTDSSTCVVEKILERPAR